MVNHVRICHGIALDRRWKFASYPTEPLLSYVTAHHLHDSPHSPETALATLESDRCHDLIDLPGQRGELTRRLLWLLSKDLYVRDHLHGPNEIVTKTSDGDLHDAELVDCQMIPVVDWLEFVFGEHVSTRLGVPLCVLLSFSRWISMENKYHCRI